MARGRPHSLRVLVDIQFFLFGYHVLFFLFENFVVEKRVWSKNSNSSTENAGITYKDLKVDMGV
jgi:hypothetical protein